MVAKCADIKVAGKVNNEKDVNKEATKEHGQDKRVGKELVNVVKCGQM